MAAGRGNDELTATPRETVTWRLVGRFVVDTIRLMALTVMFLLVYRNAWLARQNTVSRETSDWHIIFQ